MLTLTRYPIPSDRTPLLPFAVAFCLLLGVSCARAEDFCALTVNLTSFTGLPPASTWVELVDQSGEVEQREEMRGATFRICDFGFGSHTLRVGTNECLPVSISNLRVVLGRPLHLNVMLNACGYQDTLRSTCLLYLRAVDSRGAPVPDAEILFHPSTGAPARTDSFGRFQSLVRGSREIILNKSGFEAGRANAQCKETEEIDIKVVMGTAKTVGDGK
jgi:hypothetical protein